MIEDAQPKLYCVNHPNRETLLRCNRCERPICVECAVLTETGYRCRDCLRGQQKKFETARWMDYPLALAVAGVLGFLGSLLTSYLGFFTIFLAPIAGVIIAEAIRSVTGKRRARLLYNLATLAAGAGSAILPLINLLATVMGLSLFNLLGLIWQVLYVALVTSTIFYRLTGIQIR
ncbi:MAG: B-box zinc finger protein [Chloroflexota bacterium]